MASRHLSIRIANDTFDRLEAESRRSGRSRSHLAKTLLDEGLRMEAHPGIVFRDGAMGRRAGLADGADVWEVISAMRGVDPSDEEAVGIVIQNTSLNKHQILRALRYYADYPEEIDLFIQRNDEEAERAYAEWQRERNLLAR